MRVMTLKRYSKRLLLGVLIAAGLVPALAWSASSSPSFHVYGHAQFFQGAKRITTPFMGTLRVNPNFVDPRLGIVGRIVSMAVSFPVFPEVPTFNTILTQGPEISGITPLKYDVTLLNANGEELQFQFTTTQSPEVYPGFGTPMGSLVNFSGGSLMQGSNSGALAIDGHDPVFLQNFRGRIVGNQQAGQNDSEALEDGRND